MTIEEKQYICPNCGEKQTKVIQWQTVSVAWEFDLKTGESNEVDKTGGDHEDWTCPSCGESIQKELGDEITQALWG